MLGMFLVLTVMALLLGGTLHGLASYRSVMSTVESKLEEMQKAAKLSEDVKNLKNPTKDPNHQATILLDRIGPIQQSLTDYKSSLQDTIERKRAPDDGKRESQAVQAIEKDIIALVQNLQAIGPRVDPRGDLLATGSDIQKAVEALEMDVADLISNITQEISERVTQTKKEARKSIMLLITTSLMAVLMMGGLLRFFYRWVAEPIRQLEEGVSKVARGDFQHRIEIKSGDEIEDLAKAFTDMTAKLRTMYENLAEQVNERSRQLVRSEQLAGVGFLAAGVAHEINNPLASIAFCSEALESRLSEMMRSPLIPASEKETIAKYLKMIQEEAFRCKEITKKLLAFSRGGERKREETNLADVIQSVLDVVQHLQNCKGKRTEFRASGPLVAWVNAPEIKQVFLNLVVNALESMEEGGVLTITHSITPERIELVFTDTGCGMTPDVLDNIFQPFFTRSRTGKGTGLGLSISHRIITQHGGDIEAASDGPGKGSTFRIHLPVHPPELPESLDAQDPVEEFLKLSSAKQNARAA
jgi:signal transduction histidine kinase